MNKDLTLTLYCDASIGASMSTSRVQGQTYDQMKGMSYLAGIGFVGIHNNKVIHIGRKIASFTRNIAVLETQAIVLALQYGMDNITSFAEVKVFNDNMGSVNAVSRFLKTGNQKTLHISPEGLAILIKIKEARLNVKIAYQPRASCGGICLADKISRWVYTRHNSDGILGSLNSMRKNHKLNIPTIVGLMLNSDMKTYRERRLAREEASSQPRFTTVYDAAFFEEQRIERMMVAQIKGKKQLPYL